MVELAQSLSYLSAFSVLIPLAALLLYIKRRNHYYVFMLGLLIASSFLIDLVTLITIANHFTLSNVYLGNFYNIAQLVLLVLIYREFYLDEHKKTLFFAALIYFGFEIINSLFFQRLNVNQTWSWTFSALILCCLSIGYFNYLLKTDPVYTITKFGPFWINVAVLLYFGFSLYLFAMAEFVFTKMETNSAIIFWSFHNLNNILKNIIFTVGIHYSGVIRDRN